MVGRGTDALGRKGTGKFRIRSRFLLGAVVEELVELADGSKIWIPRTTPVPVSFTDNLG